MYVSNRMETSFCETIMICTSLQIKLLECYNRPTNVLLLMPKVSQVDLLLGNKALGNKW